ncbi:hypothetical protein CDEST_12194 [Colletotrichum destructivum]|uniref:Uncharacterized protein n=1 Tax=Colletotrichum destructivum TaxID=34406 RepID=A0AAX4IV73_9PEZI|nr:hypothetical protein CDEST_12194 [Colletotrichum destructivum]
MSNSSLLNPHHLRVRSRSGSERFFHGRGAPRQSVVECGCHLGSIRLCANTASGLIVVLGPRGTLISA